MKVLFREETLNVSFESKFFFFFELKKTFEVLFEEAHHRCSFKELISLLFFIFYFLFPGIGSTTRKVSIHFLRCKSCYNPSLFS